MLMNDDMINSIYILLIPSYFKMNTSLILVMQAARCKQNNSQIVGNIMLVVRRCYVTFQWARFYSKQYMVHSTDQEQSCLIYSYIR